jgi:multidrug resistance efflux pump
MTTDQANDKNDPARPSEDTSDPHTERSVQQDNSLGNYLLQVLSEYCRLKHIRQGAVLKINSNDAAHVLSAYPESGQMDPDQSWLRHAAQLSTRAISERSSILEPVRDANALYDQPPSQHILLIPFELSETGPLAAAFLVEIKDTRLLERLYNEIQHGFHMLQLSENRVRQDLKPVAIQRLTQAIDVITAVNEQDRFTAAAMAFCNELAAQWHGERVSLGFLKGKYVQVVAMNHTEEIYRKMGLIQAIELAMEECLDQDTEIFVPEPEQASYVGRASQKLSELENPSAVLSLPLRKQGRVFAVLTIERAMEKPFADREVETLRLVCELCSARLADLYLHDHWFRSLFVDKPRKTFSNILNPSHTWAKIAAVGLFLLLVFLIFAKGQFRPDAPFVLETVEQQVIPAPFDGYLKAVMVDVGETVQKDDSILATLDTAELRLQLAAARADRTGYLKQVSAAMRDNETAQAQIAQANADKAQAQIDLLDYQISQSQIRTPLGGVVVKGDLKRQIGAPVRTGDILFEVCPLESIRAQLLIPDDLILYMQVGQEGRLATASYPDKPIRFIIERIDPMAEVVNQRNVFKVRARLTETYPWMRPGMEGVAKVEVGKKHYVWIWTRKLTNWLRMKLWL